jgi:hypothetical protein
MMGVEFVTKRIAPLQNHHRPIWAHQDGDDIRLHASELNADAHGEVIRAFFSTTHIPSIPRAARPLYCLGSQDSSRATAGLPEFNASGPFLVDGVTPGPSPSALAANSEQGSSVREADPGASGDLGDDDDSGEEATHRGCSQSTVVLSDSSEEEDEATAVNQLSRGDATASSSRGLEEEEERQARVEAERRSKANAKQSSLRQGSTAAHSKEPVGETSAPPPQTSSIPSKRGWVECDAL